MERYEIRYTQDALEDLKNIYGYIAGKLSAPGTARGQVDRIRRAVRELDIMPARYARVEWEPWHSMGMRQLPVDNFVVFYLMDPTEAVVNIVRILYGGRDLKEMIKTR